LRAHSDDEFEVEQPQAEVRASRRSLSSLPSPGTQVGYSSVIFVANLPVVPPEKYEKLVAVVRKIYSQIGTIREDGLWMPVDEATQLSKGVVFIEFTSPAEAAAAAEQTDGYKLDKQHVFRVSTLDDFERYSAVPDEYAPPPEKPFEPRNDMMSWLLDSRGRDQFVVRFGDESEVYWNDAAAKRPEEIYRRSFWTESYVQWSPRGNYITTVHRQGIALWGGPSFQRLARMQHPSVQFLDFSPGERFVATCSVQEPTGPRDATQVSVCFFDTRSGRKLRAFTGGLDDFMLPGAASSAGRGVRPRLALLLAPAPLTRLPLSCHRAWPGRCSSGRVARMTSTSPRLGRTPSASTTCVPCSCPRAPPPLARMNTRIPIRPRRCG
jgi:RNA recognition motif. (a.k.a. RRM, RBD, or RNP domain)